MHGRGIEYTHRARQVQPLELCGFHDYLIAASRSHMAELQYLASRAGATLALLMDYAPAAGVRDVPDPYYTGGFDEVYELVEQASRPAGPDRRASERVSV
ncbi:MAG: hypothetical protein U0177_20935 [Kouleothrix sp.]